MNSPHINAPAYNMYSRPAQRVTCFRFFLLLVLYSFYRRLFTYKRSMYSRLSVVLISFMRVMCFPQNAIKFWPIVLYMFYVDSLPQKSLRKSSETLETGSTNAFRVEKRPNFETKTGFDPVEYTLLRLVYFRIRLFIFFNYLCV